MKISCSFCRALPELKCCCGPIEEFLCKEHIAEHEKSRKYETHSYMPLFEYIKEEQKSEALQQLTKVMNEFKLKQKLIKEALKNIMNYGVEQLTKVNNIINFCKKLVQELSLNMRSPIFHKKKSYNFEVSDFEAEFDCKIMSFPSFKLFKNENNAKEQAALCWPITKNEDIEVKSYLIIRNAEELLEFDVENLTKRTILKGKELEENFDILCSLPNQLSFCYGKRYSSWKYWIDARIIDAKSKSIEKINSTYDTKISDSFQCSGFYFNCSVYIFTNVKNI